MKPSVDRNKCQGHALCCSVAPGVFALDDDESAVPIVDVVPQSLHSDALAAAATCPERAISIAD